MVPAPFQLLIYLTRTALAESNNLYLQSLMVVTSTLSNPIPPCLVL